MGEPSEPVSAAIAALTAHTPGKLILQDGLEPLRARSAWTGSRRSGRWKAVHAVVRRARRYLLVRYLPFGLLTGRAGSSGLYCAMPASTN